MAYNHKRGDSFDLSGQVSVSDGGTLVPDMTGWQGACQIRTLDGALVADVTFTWLDASQRLCRLYKESTSSWPVGVAEFDIQFTSPLGVKISTSVEQIQITKGVTGAST